MALRGAGAGADAGAGAGSGAPPLNLAQRWHWRCLATYRQRSLSAACGSLTPLVLRRKDPCLASDFCPSAPAPRRRRQPGLELISARALYAARSAILAVRRTARLALAPALALARAGGDAGAGAVAGAAPGWNAAWRWRRPAGTGAGYGGDPRMRLRYWVWRSFCDAQTTPLLRALALAPALALALAVSGALARWGAGALERWRLGALARWSV
jgi:hypothetical protein